MMVMIMMTTWYLHDNDDGDDDVMIEASVEMHSSPRSDPRNLELWKALQEFRRISWIDQEKIPLLLKYNSPIIRKRSIDVVFLDQKCF